MPKIHYFQRYSSIENTVTNNTLQLLARVYDYSAASASKLLTNVTGEAVDIGIEVTQQQRVGKSVPDGTILQRSFKIVIETKVDSPVDTEQLRRHARTFSNESQKILLLLTRDSIGTSYTELQRSIHSVSPDIVFKAITYEDVCESLRGLFKDHEVTMTALADDFIEYCNDANLFDQAKFLLRIVPCGQSLAINKKYGIYFHPSDRGYTPHSYIGIYAQKTVQAIIAIGSVVDIEYVNRQLLKVPIDGAPTDRYDDRIINIIRDARTDCGYEIAVGHRFFCGEVVDTDFRKTSPGGIQGARFVNLRDLLGSFSGANDVAARLRDKVWV